MQLHQFESAFKFDPLLNILSQIDQSVQSRNLSQLQKSGNDLRGTALNPGLEKVAATSFATEQLSE
jgi:hypothetical protein